MFDMTMEDVELVPQIPRASGNCTVVSIMPFPLKELKPQIIPGYFQIPASRDGEPVCLPVGESIHWMESPFKGMPPMKVTETSKSMAKSIVNDFMEGMLAVDTDTLPGIFWVEGHFDVAGIRKNYNPNLERAIAKQNRWFIELIKIADDDWAKYHQHRAITDIQRCAAKALGMQREWLSATIDMQMTNCPLCKELVRPDAIVHTACGYILNPTAYEQMSSRIIKKTTMDQLNSIGVK